MDFSLSILYDLGKELYYVFSSALGMDLKNLGKNLSRNDKEVLANLVLTVGGVLGRSTVQTAAVLHSAAVNILKLQEDLIPGVKVIK